MVLGECSSRIPYNGGDYQYLRRALGRPLGFLSGWTAFLIGFPGSLAFLSNALVDSIAPSSGPMHHLLGLLVLVCITVLCLFPLRVGARINAWVVAGTILILVAATQLGAPLSTAWEGPVHGGNVGGALVSVFFAYSGWNVVTFVAGECENPSRVVPRAMLSGLVLVTILYVAFNAALISSSSPEFLTQADHHGLEVTRSLFGPIGSSIITVVVAFAITTTLISTCLAGPRITQKMSEQGDFFSWFQVTDPETQVPRRATIIQGLIAGILLISGSFNDVLSWTVFSMVLFGALTAVAQIRLRRMNVKEPGHRVFLDPLFPLSTLIYGACCCWVLVSILRNQTITHTIIGTGLMGAGLVLFLLTRREHGPGLNS
jgi:APA family basic amino acid/polyamine antiporter